MSITEISATGLLRVMVPPGPDPATSELAESATRSIALASLQAASGVRAAAPEIPSRALTAPRKNVAGRNAKRSTTSSGDYRARARKGHRDEHDGDGDAASTFSGLL